jgi:FkbM family methyltransferase
MSYSQIGQDLRVVEFYNKKYGGYFIEVGANDGINLSNTYLLETKFGWKGICAEPIPSAFEKLVKNRPNSICCDKAVLNKSGEKLNFDIANEYDLLSGISSYIDAHKASVDRNKTTIQVETISLTELLDSSNAPTFIEYMSLDTEGSEYDILKPFNFNKYTFGLIDVEHNYIEPRRTHIRELLESHGYIYVGENKWDDMYMHSSVKQS